MNLATWLLIAAQIAAGGTDAYQTHRAMQGPAPTEFDPVARPFVRRTATLVPYFSATTALHIALPLVVLKRHRRLQRLAQIEGIVDNGAAATATGLNLLPNRHVK